MRVKNLIGFHFSKFYLSYFLLIRKIAVNFWSEWNSWKTFRFKTAWFLDYFISQFCWVLRFSVFSELIYSQSTHLCMPGEYTRLWFLTVAVKCNCISLKHPLKDYIYEYTRGHSIFLFERIFTTDVSGFAALQGKLISFRHLSHIFCEHSDNLSMFSVNQTTIDDNNQSTSCLIRK